MKKIVLMILVCLTVVMAHSQFYVFGEGQASYDTKKAVIDKPEYFFINAFFSFNFKKKASKGFGLFVEETFEPDAASLSPGILYRGTSKKGVYQEGGIGIGFEFPRKVLYTEVGKFLNDYYYLETKIDRRVKDKLIVNLNHSYSKEWHHWYMVSALYFPTKWLGLGAHAQRYAATGARVQFALPGNINVWGAGWPGERAQVAVNFSF